MAALLGSEPMNRRRPLPIAILAACLPALLLLQGCSSTEPNRDPTGEVFPAVVGESLERERVELPAAFAGEPVVLLVGYEQRTQFDIDRWAMGLMQAEASAPIVELPTIPGLVPTLISGWIDDGMRSGIPEEDWAAVVTLYGGAARPIARMTGTESGHRTRVLVLDAMGRVVWFDDEGYSASKAMAVAALVDTLRDS